MGTWGTKAFDNDGAMDLIDEYVDQGAVIVDAALPAELNLGPDGTDDEFYGDTAIASAEIVAACYGHPMPAEEEADLARIVLGEHEEPPTRPSLLGRLLGQKPAEPAIAKETPTKILAMHAEGIQALPDIRARAIAALDSVMDGKDWAGLRSSWEETDYASEFLERVSGLRTRLEQSK